MRRRGFTLIELLVVIAIIGILAAMLFPVFARARESARKTQCLANVKNLAIAFNMYFTDYDRFPPGEANYKPFADIYGCDYSNFEAGCGCPNATYANPYLRWPVILDDYVKNRDVWRCPSAKAPTYAGWIVGASDWLGEVKAVYDSGCQGCPCQVYWPNGWGGSVTDNLWAAAATGGDSSVMAGASTGAFELDYASNYRADLGRNLSTINDPSHHFVLVERGAKNDFWRIEQIAYPDSCHIFLDRMADRKGDPDEDCAANWEDCPETQSCSADPNDPIGWWNDEQNRKALARHLGGNNIGYADGHAKWMTAGAMIAAANADPQEFEPIDGQPSWWPNANPNPD